MGHCILDVETLSAICFSWVWSLVGQQKTILCPERLRHFLRYTRAWLRVLSRIPNWVDKVKLAKEGEHQSPLSFFTATAASFLYLPSHKHEPRNYVCTFCSWWQNKIIHFTLQNKINIYEIENPHLYLFWNLKDWSS